MPNPYDLTTHDGKTVDWLTHCALLEMELRLGYRLTIVQGSYHSGVGASAGTHDRGGVIDLSPWDWANKVKVGRQVGFAIWHRAKIPGVWNEHIHGVLVGNAKLASAAGAQVVDYRNHRNGLKGHAADSSWHPDPIPVYKWPGSAGALALEAKAKEKLDKPKVDINLRVDGIDLSHHNTGITQAALNQADTLGVKYAYLKCTEGTTVVDPKYVSRRAMVRTAGMAVGAYHFGRPDKDGRDGSAEAKFFLEHAKIAVGDMRPVLDLEDGGTLSQAALTQWVRNFADTVKEEIGCYPIVYTPFDLNSTCNCMLWVARYSNDNLAPKVPKPWKTWRMRQFSNGRFGRPNSIAGMHVDLNTLHDGEKLSWLQVPVRVPVNPDPPIDPPVDPPRPPEPKSTVLTFVDRKVLKQGSSDHKAVVCWFKLSSDQVWVTGHANLQGTDKAVVSEAYQDQLLATGGADSWVWNELTTLSQQQHALALPGWDTYMANSGKVLGIEPTKSDLNAVAISWRTDTWELVQGHYEVLHGGSRGLTPVRVCVRVQLRHLLTGELVWRQGSHTVHHVEAGGKARVAGALLGQNARAKLSFRKLVDNAVASTANKTLIGDTVVTSPLVGSADLNVDFDSDRAHFIKGDATPWFPYTVFRSWFTVYSCNKGDPTHGNRKIDWFWFRQADKEIAS